MHKIFPGGSLHLGETSLKNQVCPGGSVDYQMVTCDYFKVYHLKQRYALPNGVPPSPEHSNVARFSSLLTGL